MLDPDSNSEPEPYGIPVPVPAGPVPVPVPQHCFIERASYLGILSIVTQVNIRILPKLSR
jgi:hypothetical protein